MDRLAEDATVPATASGVAGVTLAHNVEATATVDEFIYRAVAAGARLVKPPEVAE